MRPIAQLVEITEEMFLVARMIRDHGPLTLSEVRRKLHMTRTHMDGVLIAVTYWFPIYEEDSVPQQTILGWNDGLYGAADSFFGVFSSEISSSEDASA